MTNHKREIYEMTQLLDQVAIFIKSWKNDLCWLPYCLRSIALFFPSCDEIHLVADEDCRSTIESWGLTREKVHYVPNHPNGYLQQQAIKLQAHHYTDRKFILFMDSDCIFTRPVDEAGLFVVGKPAFLKTRYTTLGDKVPWQQPTEEILGHAVEFEYMRRIPILVDRQSLELISQRHPDLVASLFASGKTRVFSEFNLIGAISEELLPELYEWIDTDLGEPPNPIAKQFWSWGGLSDDIRRQIHCLLSHAEDRKPQTARPCDDGATGKITWLESGIAIIKGDTHISKWVAESGTLAIADRLLAPYRHLVEEDGTIVDVGANIGDHTETYASWVPLGKVLAFEPNPIAFECLVHNTRRHANVVPISLAISDTFGTEGMALEKNAGASYLRNGEGLQVPMIPLDSFGLRRLQFLKVDAEGYEARILKGAKETIRRCRPVMMIEVNSGALNRAGTSADELLSIIKRYRYSVELVGTNKNWNSRQFDVICRPLD